MSNDVLSKISNSKIELSKKKNPDQDVNASPTTIPYNDHRRNLSPQNSLNKELSKIEDKINQSNDVAHDGTFNDDSLMKQSINHKNRTSFEIKQEDMNNYDANNLIYKENVLLPNNARYTGYFLNELKHGYGVQIWPDGAKYEGYWKNNKAFGKGKFIHVDGDIYDGEWLDDKANGFGIYIHTNGAKYEGNWINDLQEGFGKESWSDGAKFEGIYTQGKKQGKGTYIWANGSKFTGDWVDNKISGIVFFNRGFMNG